MSQDQNAVKAIVDQLAEHLGEKEYGPRRLLFSIVQECGVDFAQQVLQQTMEVEQQGGMLLTDGTRRRTVGGVFFYLARGRMTSEMRRLVFPTRAKRKKGSKSKPPKPQSSFNWAERHSPMSALLEEKGEATTVKITLIGRPGRVDVRKDVVLTTMTHAAKSPTLPKGVPMPPETPTTYTVYIALKQWNKVVDSINDNPQDALIIEGLCAFDSDLGAIAVFAQSTTSKLIEQQKREAQREQTPEKVSNGDGAANMPAEVSPSQPRSNRTHAAPAPLKPATTVNIPPDASHEDAQKLRDLYAAADLYRGKLSDIQATPSSARFGLEMTQKLLKNVEDQIKAVEEKYA